MALPSATLLAQSLLSGIFIGALYGLLGLGLSLRLSIPYAIWDRQWHIPLVASLRGQRAPFARELLQKCHCVLGAG